MNSNRLLLVASILVLAFAIQACGTLSLDIFDSPTPTPTQFASQIPSQTPALTAQPEITETVEPTAPPDEAAEVSGRLCYPSEFIPTQELYFFRLNDSQLFSTQSVLNQAEYSIELEPGAYYAYAWVEDYQLGGAYTEYVACGDGENCVDHTLKAIDVQSGQLVEKIDLCDWIYPEEMLPADMRRVIFGAGDTPASPLGGLVIGSPQGAWMIGLDGQERLLTGNSFIQFSPDGTLGVFERDFDLWLVDLTTNTERNLTNTPNRLESSFTWSPYLPNHILFTSFNIAEEAGPGFSGYLSMLDLEGSQYQILDSEHNAGSYAVSPDGNTIIYGIGPEPHLYSFTNGLGTFNPAEYGFISEGGLTLGSPAWSPDGSAIIFTASATLSGQEQFGVARFDLAAKSSQFIFTYQVMGMDGWPTSGNWSADVRWLAISVLDMDPNRGGLWVISSDGNPALRYKVAGLGTSGVWHPRENLLVYSQPDSSNQSKLWMFDANTLANKPLEIANTDTVFPLAWVEP